jgi:hypothetical protein
MIGLEEKSLHAPFEHLLLTGDPATKPPPPLPALGVVTKPPLPPPLLVPLLLPKVSGGRLSECAQLAASAGTKAMAKSKTDWRSGRTETRMMASVAEKWLGVLAVPPPVP